MTERWVEKGRFPPLLPPSNAPVYWPGNVFRKSQRTQVFKKLRSAYASRRIVMVIVIVIVLVIVIVIVFVIVIVIAIVIVICDSESKSAGVDQSI